MKAFDETDVAASIAAPTTAARAPLGTDRERLFAGSERAALVYTLIHKEAEQCMSSHDGRALRASDACQGVHRPPKAKRGRSSPSANHIGIRPIDLPGFIVAQLVVALCGMALSGWLLCQHGDAEPMNEEAQL